MIWSHVYIHIQNPGNKISFVQLAEGGAIRTPTHPHDATLFTDRDYALHVASQVSTFQPMRSVVTLHLVPDAPRPNVCNTRHRKNATQFAQLKPDTP